MSRVFSSCLFKSGTIDVEECTACDTIKKVVLHQNAMKSILPAFQNSMQVHGGDRGVILLRKLNLCILQNNEECRQ